MQGIFFLPAISGKENKLKPLRSRLEAPTFGCELCG
jgi:hypothetical protein